MQTRTQSGKTRYDLAREEGLSLLEHYPTTPVTIVQLSHIPQVLTPLTRNHEEARRAIASSQPTWLSAGTSQTLQGLLTGQGGLGSFDRIVLLTDRSLAPPLPGVRQVIFAGGENLAITTFTVREDADRQGTTAFLKLRNDTASYREGVVRVSDGTHQALLSVLLPPGSEQAYTLPFPGSRGPWFTATIEPEDDFPVDNVRYFTLHRSIERRVRWIGQANRYLEAALSAAGPITLTPPDDLDPVDLTVAYNTQLPSDTTGNVLLIHAGLDGLITIGEDVEIGALVAVKQNDRLLDGVDPFNFRVRSCPRVVAPKDGTTVLTLEQGPFLYRLEEEDRMIVLIASDLMQTNLPLTVDFPLLIRNILETFAPRSAPLPHAWAIVGEPLRIDEYGSGAELVDPSGRKIMLSQGALSFIPEVPGIYTLKAGKGTYPLAVNVDPLESEPASDMLTDTPVDIATEQAQTLYPIWPVFAGMGLLALLLEAGMYQGWRWRKAG